MTTIRQIAKELGVSCETVFMRCKELNLLHTSCSVEDVPETEIMISEDVKDDVKADLEHNGII